MDQSSSFSLSMRTAGSSGCRLNAAPKDCVLFLDLDNTLYSQKTGVSHQMARRIELFFVEHLGLPHEEGVKLGAKYYLDYGLAVRGLLKHFDLDVQNYDAFVDGGLDLSEVERMRGDREHHAKFYGVLGLEGLLKSCVARKWIFTNAGMRHVRRMIDVLQISEQIESVVYCDYAEPEFPAKPDRIAFERAMAAAGLHAQDNHKCYFVDDSATNVRVALELGWHAVHLCEENLAVESIAAEHGDLLQIKTLAELPNVFPELFL